MARLTLSAFLVTVVAIPAARAQVLFQSNLSSDEGFVVAAGSDNDFLFGYDYQQSASIPEAPNSTLVSGEPFQGLRLAANLSQGLASGIAVVTDGLQLSGRYAVQVDAWLNYNLPDGEAGTTEFGGIAIGHDGVTAGLSGASLVYDTDGNTRLDYRLYRNDAFQDIDSGSYSVSSLDNLSEPFVSAFPAIDVADAVPGQLLLGMTSPGTGGFRWLTVEAEVDTEAIGAGPTNDRGVAKFSLTDAATGNRVFVGTMDNSAGGPVVDLTGDVGLLMLDLFSSVSPSPGLSFGVFDNLIITQLEPEFSPLDCNTDGNVDAGDLHCVTGDTLEPLLNELQLLAGDFDGDKTVAFADFIQVSQHFGAQVGSYVEGDANLDGIVSFPDFVILSGNFGKTFASAAAVPEPAAHVLFIGLLCATASGCRLAKRRRTASR